MSPSIVNLDRFVGRERSCEATTQSNTRDDKGTDAGDTFDADGNRDKYGSLRRFIFLKEWFKLCCFVGDDDGVD